MGSALDCFFERQSSNPAGWRHFCCGIFVSGVQQRHRLPSNGACHHRYVSRSDSQSNPLLDWPCLCREYRLGCDSYWKSTEHAYWTDTQSVVWPLPSADNHSSRVMSNSDLVHRHCSERPSGMGFRRICYTYPGRQARRRICTARYLAERKGPCRGCYSLYCVSVCAMAARTYGTSWSRTFTLQSPIAFKTHARPCRLATSDLVHGSICGQPCHATNRIASSSGGGIGIRWLRHA